MLLVLALGAAIWMGGAALRASRGLRWALLGVLYLAVLAIHTGLPSGHALRAATGQELSLWLILGGVAALVLAYRTVLLRLRRKASAVGEAAQATGPAKPLFSAAELERYARHIILREVGGPGQKRLKQARVLMIGAGGLGAPVLQYLAAAGVGTIGVIDDDHVEASNLQRQVIHIDDRIGLPKVQSASEAMQDINPFVTVRPYQRRLDEENAEALFADYDLIVDGTDHFPTRYLANRVAAAQGKPLVSGALSQWEGQVSVFDPARGGPCYQCVFPEAPAPGLAPTCAEAGVIGALPGVVGSMMAVEVIKRLTGAGEALTGQMLIYDALYGETRKIALNRRPDCPICGTVPAAT